MGYLEERIKRAAKNRDKMPAKEPLKQQAPQQEKQAPAQSQQRPKTAPLAGAKTPAGYVT